MNAAGGRGYCGLAIENCYVSNRRMGVEGDPAEGATGGGSRRAVARELGLLDERLRGRDGR